MFLWINHKIKQKKFFFFLFFFLNLSLIYYQKKKKKKKKKKKEKKSKYWIREKPIRLIHIKTGNRLCSYMNYIYNDPIRGQMEVCAVSKNNVQSQWKVMEGFFFSLPEDESK